MESAWAFRSAIRSSGFPSSATMIRTVKPPLLMTWREFGFVCLHKKVKNWCFNAAVKWVENQVLALVKMGRRMGCG